MARNGVNNSLLISAALSFLKNLFNLVTIPILFLSKVSDVFKNKSKSCLHVREELESQETKTNLDYEEEEGLIEISLVSQAEEGWMSKEEEYYQEMTIMEIWEELEAEENLIEIDIYNRSIVNNSSI
ncbi:hypothetical protein Bca52824_010792 [Brassica carinata]|uniref:Uncharacterized protein n=1 Tax=Brassica carinata TaxID=52824 RepID=A0A8X7WCC4_BRACI|nr:hypothetical protein Bca52824_010792 [Brassica carinata]